MRFRERDQSSIRSYQRISLEVSMLPCRKENAWSKWPWMRVFHYRRPQKNSTLNLPLPDSSLRNIGKLATFPWGTSEKKCQKPKKHRSLSKLRKKKFSNKAVSSKKNNISNQKSYTRRLLCFCTTLLTKCQP